MRSRMERYYSIFCGIVAFMALRCAKNADSERDTIFHCTILVLLLQYMLTLAIHEARVGYVRAAA